MSEDPVPGPTKRSVLVLYASETGNAQEVAEELGDLAERLHFVTQVSEMNNFKPVSSFLLFSVRVQKLTQERMAGIPRIAYVYDFRRVDYRPG